MTPDKPTPEKSDQDFYRFLYNMSVSLRYFFIAWDHYLKEMEKQGKKLRFGFLPAETFLPLDDLELCKQRFRNLPPIVQHDVQQSLLEGQYHWLFVPSDKTTNPFKKKSPLCAACGKETAPNASLCEACEAELLEQPCSWDPSIKL